jgi:hypothetical protein
MVYPALQDAEPVTRPNRAGILVSMTDADAAVLDEEAVLRTASVEEESAALRLCAAAYVERSVTTGLAGRAIRWRVLGTCPGGGDWGTALMRAGDMPR